MHLSKEQYEERKARARAVIVRDPHITARALAEACGWSVKHAWKIRQVVLAERVKHINNELLVEVEKFGQTIEELCKECWRIIDDKSTREVFDKEGNVVGVVLAIAESDRLRAIEVLAKNMKMLLDVKFDAGVFTKKLGEVQINSFNVFVDLVKQFAHDQRPNATPPDGAPAGDQPGGPALSKPAE